jgi:hypothetical protein
MHPVLLAVSPIATVFVTHFVSSNLYNQLCVPLSFQGFITSIISTASPVCSGLLNVMNLSSQAYSVAIVSGFTLLLNGLGMKQVEIHKQA